ncbi:TetR/AcrR family transcriptional regulator [Actinoplanes bogorensis]|uniref:TetR/AcrR family transcriptional regulator n=1 Tax=Paractinoplanes bogorensis TaxID=1610840 RepID=A0ABS5Z5M0_9ACTN|nr:TetR/AcrR family transcriptional regulator [Actinoplanes bogorensis]MBU2670233.1 TetR/AcrR family transcriptional regulator [Actinoplanes bogorensis]
METTGARTRNRRGEGARLRDDILAAATAVLDETGDGQAVTLRAVARRAGISAPSIYPHFPDRDAILLALVRDAFAELTAQLRAAAPSLPAVCDAYLAFAAARPHRYRLMFGGVYDAAPAVHAGSLPAEEATALGRDALTVFVEAIDACVRSGRSTSTDPYADAIALWLGLHGLAHQRSVLSEFPWPADITDRLIHSLAHLEV